MQYLCWSVENGLQEVPAAPVSAAARAPATVPTYSSEEKSGDVVIVADLQEDDIQLKNMIDRFCAVHPRKTRIVNIREYPFRGGCLGCFHCAVSGT